VTNLSQTFLQGQEPILTKYLLQSVSQLNA